MRKFTLSASILIMLYPFFWLAANTARIVLRYHNGLKPIISYLHIGTPELTLIIYSLIALIAFIVFIIKDIRLRWYMLTFLAADIILTGVYFDSVVDMSRAIYNHILLPTYEVISFNLEYILLSISLLSSFLIFIILLISFKNLIVFIIRKLRKTDNVEKNSSVDVKDTESNISVGETDGENNISVDETDNENNIQLDNDEIEEEQQNSKIRKVFSLLLAVGAVIIIFGIIAFSIYRILSAMGAI